MAKPAVGWFEVTGKDGPGLQRFYSTLFDWKIADAGGGSGYGLIEAGPQGIAGGIGASPDGGPGQVTFYVEVEDLAAYLAKAEELGGTTVMPCDRPLEGCGAMTVGPALRSQGTTSSDVGG